MTATATTPTGQTRLEDVALSSIKAHPDNVRIDVGDVTDLAASIESVGLLEPLVVAPPHTGMSARSMGKATHLLIAGHRRLAAAKKAKLATVPVLIRSDLTTRGAQIEAMLVENLQRVNLTPVEEADAYQLLLDIDGLTQKDLAAKLGQPASRIRDRLKLAKIGEAGRSALQAHQVTIEQALEISEFDDDPKAQKALVKAIGSNNYSFTLNTARREREEAAALATRLEQLEKNGVTVLDDPPKGAKKLEELLDGFPRTWEADSKIDAAEKRVHKDCPGRATYWVQEYSRKLVHGCTQPKLHPKTKPSKTKAELKAEAEAAARKEEATKGAGAAAEARATFLREQLAKVSDPVIVRARLQALIIDRFNLEANYYRDLKGARLLLEILGAPVPEVPKDTSEDQQAEDLTEALEQPLSRLSVNALVLALDIATHLAGETNLRAADAYPTPSTYSSGRAWTETLTAYGYPWSDWERERFTGREYSSEGSQDWNVDGPVADEPTDGAPAENEAGDQ